MNYIELRLIAERKWSEDELLKSLSSLKKKYLRKPAWDRNVSLPTLPDTGLCGHNLGNKYVGL